MFLRKSHAVVNVLLSSKMSAMRHAHFVAIKQDVTEQKRLEEMLQNNENKYRVLFEDAADAHWLMDERAFWIAIRLRGRCSDARQGPG
jgi:PAS domain-containing protein